MNIEEFEKIMQRDDKEEKEEDLEKIWDDKSEWFFKRTEKKQENFYWMKNFTKEKEFDLVFASMTPAISKIEHINRMCLISKNYCMMERFVYYRDPVREEIEKMLGRKLNKLHSNHKEYTYGLWNIVWKLGYFPEIYLDKYISETEKTVIDYMEQIICTDDEENKIIEFLKGKEKKGKIMSKEYIIKAVILWDVNIF